MSFPNLKPSRVLSVLGACCVLLLLAWWAGTGREPNAVPSPVIIGDSAIAWIGEAATHGASQGSPWISVLEVEKRLAQGSAVLIDIRDRGNLSMRPGLEAINIPFDELAVRATHELSARQLLIIDCFDVSRAICSLAADELARQGFERVAIADAKPLESQSCSQ